MSGAIDMGTNNISNAGTITGSTLTDGTLSINAGNITTTGTIDGRDVSDLGADVDDAISLTGQAANTTNFGTTFTGVTISDNATITSALQELETSLETQTDDQTAAEVTSTATGNIAATNVDAAIAELEAEKLALAGGTMSGAIDMNTNSISGVNNLAATSLTLGGVNVTASATELNYTDITTTGTAEASKALVTDASNNISGINDFGVTGNVTIGNASFLQSAINGAGNTEMGSSTVANGATIPFGTIGLAVDGDIVSNRDIYASGNLTFSDARYKKDIKPLEDVSSNLRKLEGVTYLWRTEEFPDNNFSDREQIGLIAQEVEKVYPELVNTLPNGYKTVNYQALVPVLIEAIKEQQKLIDKLMADLSDEKTSKAELKAALENQQKLSMMQMELMTKLQSENTSIKSDVELLKEIVLGTKTAKE